MGFPEMTALLIVIFKILEWIYTEAGTYTVSLTVSDGADTDTETKENYITIISLDVQNYELIIGYQFLSSRIISENQICIYM